MKRLIPVLAFAFNLSACASSMPEERKDYILSRPHGFIEITISDNSVPNVIPSSDDAKKPIKPASCYLSVQANSEPFFGQPVYPDGSEPPYKVRSGFRFPMPIGEHTLILTYDDCRASEGGIADSIKTTTDINVQNNIVYEIVFTDGKITKVIEKSNDEVTLKQILEAVKK